MFYQYGLYKPLVNKKLGTPATIRQFFPLLFVVGLIVGGVLSCLSWVIAAMYVLVLLIYLFLSFYFTMKSIKKTKKWGLLLYQPLLYFTVHVSYGWGYIVGIYKILLHKPFNAESNR